MTRDYLFERGKEHIQKWTEANGVRPVQVVSCMEPSKYDTCAFYRDDVIYIDVPACATVGMVGRAYSYPGYVVDRTPYGVLAHELGHHVEEAHGARGGIIAKTWFEETREEKLTNYCPNVNEWFAEIFRLFVTNPTLLKELRPLMFARLSERWPNQIETRDWQFILRGVPRQLKAAQNKVAAVKKKGPRLPL